MTTTSTTSAPKELNHPDLADLCKKLVSAREISDQMDKTKKQASDDIKAILAEFPDDKKFSIYGYTAQWQDNNYSNAAAFRQSLIDQGVDPEVIKNANEAAKTKGDPKLVVAVKKEKS